MLGIFLDIETTGLDPLQHVPIDVAIKVLDLSTGDLLGSFESIVKQDLEKWNKRDPGSIEINGFSWQELQRGKDVAAIAEEIIALFKQLGIQRGGAVFICQNPSFDRGFFNQIIPVYTQEGLNWPYHWLDLASMYWARRTQEALAAGEAPLQKIALSKNDIAKYFGLDKEEEPHHAMGGVNHLILCYHHVLPFSQSIRG
jgi:DNA polymerase-3 subunit epsilon/oligoribonuclease